MNPDPEWKDLDTFSEKERHKTLALINDFIKTHPRAVMDHDLEWLFTKCGHEKTVKALVCFAQDGSLIGYAPFFVHPSALSFGLFGISFFDYRIRRYSITAEPLLRADQPALQALLKSLFSKIRDFLGQRDALFGLGVERKSVFGQFLSNNIALQKNYLILPMGASYQRRLILLPEDIEKYISNLGYSTRYEVRRALRKLHSKTTVTYHVYSEPHEVKKLLKLLYSVSVKTYQHQLLNLGISDDEETFRILNHAAKAGWLRSLILLCNNQPVAFEHGFLYNGIYYLTHMGYDPDWTKFSVGTIAHIYTVENLIQMGAKKFDFLYGDNGSKKRLSNISREEQNFYLIPRKIPLIIIAHTLRLFNALIEKAGEFTERYGIKSRIRRLLRRKSTRS